MHVISYTESHVIRYWTGSGWTTDKGNAKQFNSRASARAEVQAAGIVYQVRITAA